MAFKFDKGMVAVQTNKGFEKLDPYIEASSLNITPDQMQDLDSYVNANGKLKRTTMPYSRSKIEFNIKHTDEKTMNETMTILNSGTKISGGIYAENKVKVRFYNPKRMEYNEAWFYFPDITFGVYGTYNGDGEAIFVPTRMAFISYGEKVNR